MQVYYFPEYPEALLLKEFLKNKEGLKPKPFKDIVPWEPFLVLNGSGNNHQRTLDVLERVKPNTYLHIDNHPDLGRPGKIHEGNFVRYLPGCVQDVFLAGMSHTFSDVRGNVNVNGEKRRVVWDFFCDMKRDRKLLDKIRLLPGQEMLFQFTNFRKSDPELIRGNSSSDTVMLGDFEADELTLEKLIEPPRLLAGFRGIRDMANLLKDRRLYISLDLDVLSPSEGIATDFDSGCLRVMDLLKMLRNVRESNQILGMDICGLSAHELTQQERRDSLRNIGKLFREISRIF